MASGVGGVYLTVRLLLGRPALQVSAAAQDTIVIRRLKYASIWVAFNDESNTNEIKLETHRN